MAKQPPLCRKGCDFGTRHWPNERCLSVTPTVTQAPEPVTKSVTAAPIVADGVTPVPGRAEVVTQTVTPRESLQEPPLGTKWTLGLKPEPGEACSLCGHVAPMTNAQRQAAYRGRKS